MGISRRAYAELRGVSEMAVRKAIKAGRISVEADGTIDPDRANLEWDRNTDPQKQRGEHAPYAAGSVIAAAAAAAAPVEEREAAAQALRAEDEEEDDLPAAAQEAQQMSWNKARMALDVIKAQTAKFRLEVLKGEYVKRDAATQLVFDLARRERDAWQSWPARVAANMAAELKVEPHALEQVLDKYLREHLAEMAGVKVDLR